MRILLVEDEPALAEAIVETFEDESYAVDHAASGESASELKAINEYDLIVLDWSIPPPSGIELLRAWRAGGDATPVLMLTGHADPTEVVGGLDTGADDYLTKPFRMEELVARVRALIRRASGHADAVIAAGHLRVDTRQMRVLMDGEPVPVSPLEYRLVCYLVHHAGRVVPAGELIEHLYGDGDARDANALEAVITRLRRKLGADAIETRRGFGYLVADAPA
jgi:DNA-binding response OmpR family regulator